jgi:hypothetical protein
MLDVTLSQEEVVSMLDGHDEEAPLIAALVATLLAHQERHARPAAQGSQLPDSWRLMGLWQQLQGPASG